MAENWLIRNAELVNEGRRWHADLRIAEGRIESIGNDLAARAGERVLDAAGKWLLPGMIDEHVHFREPGMTAKADIAHESRACLAGGITSFMEMPNTLPSATTLERLEAKYARAAQTSLANYAFHFGASNDNADIIRQLDPRRISAVKLFLCTSTGDLCVDNPQALEAIFTACPVPLLAHCEDPTIVHANLAAARARWGDDIPAAEHARIRSREACVASTRTAMAMARQHGTRLHVLHVSTADEAAMFTADALGDKHISAETCAHFLHFDADDYARLGMRIKCNPAIKDAGDRSALIRALGDGHIDVLATDHAPHLASEKAQPYTHAPSGLPTVQHALVCALEQVFAGTLSLERLVEVTSHAPAQVFAVENRGFLREGYAADLVLVDPEQPSVVDDAPVLSKCGWSPFAGETFHARVAATFVNGHLAWDGSRIVTAQTGERLAFNR